MTDRSTYDDLAHLLQTSKEVLYSVASKHPEIFRPDDTEGGLYYFTAESVERIKEWWSRHSQFRVKPPPTDEPAYTAKQLKSEFAIPFSTVQHYRREYQMLYPDFYAPNPSGRGRPVAMYLESTIAEFKAWIEAGRPETPYMRVRMVTLNQGLFDAIVQFRDGTTVGLIDDEWTISPPPEQEDEAGHYIRFASRWVASERYALKWARNKKADTP